MNVGAAIRFFSSKTASALKTAVDNGILPQEALSTAEFILTNRKMVFRYNISNKENFDYRKKL